VVAVYWLLRVGGSTGLDRGMGPQRAQLAVQAMASTGRWRLDPVASACKIVSRSEGDALLWAGRGRC
jgi:hypothetical protein